MLIARQKKQENIAEYLLYMWQVEDIIRACGGDIDLIRQRIIDGYQGLSPEIRQEMTDWYDNLCEMMRIEGVMEKGHLQINKNVIIELTDLHQRLLKSTREPFYGAAFFKALPHIVELRARSGNAEAGEIETCFNALYGILLLGLQKKAVSPDTEKAVQAITQFLALLSEKYKQERAGELEL